MDKVIRNILKKIEYEGYEAYIIGGFVRDKLLGKVSYDIDICTNALPMTLKQIFEINQESNGYGGFNLKIKKYNIDITTYRKEKKYDNRHPIEIEYVNNLLEDIKRRDFTINTLCMDKNDNIIDLLNAKADLDNHLIKIIDNPDVKFIDDPLRMLRAIRFATTLNFTIDKETYESICKNSKYTEKLSNLRVKEELSKILSSKDFMKGLNLLADTGISNYIGLKYKDVVYTSDILGMWAQLEINKVDFSKTEKENITRIKQILHKGEIGNFELFNYGLYICIVAGDILNVRRNIINQKYKKLPIKSMKDIDITGLEIINLLGIEPGKLVSEIFSTLKKEILSDNLNNRKNEIKRYVLEKWAK